MDSSFNPSSSETVSKKLDLTSLGFQLTEIGSNQMPSVSSDEKEIVFVSSNRPNHKQGQIYIYNLDSLTEKRITYQDGECQSPILINNGKNLIYSSNTDELKENPLLFVKSADSKDSLERSPLLAMELYSSDLSGNEINRLTFRKGLDGHAWQRPDRPQSFIYSVQQDGHLQAWQINIEQNAQVALLQKKNISIESLRPSNSIKKWAWIERSGANNSTVHTSMGKLPGIKEDKISLPIGDYRDLNWLDEDRLLFSAKIAINEKPSKYYQIYSYHISNHCLENIFESNSNLISPQLMRKNQSLIFVSDLSGSFQIYSKALPSSGQCLQF